MLTFQSLRGIKHDPHIQEDDYLLRWSADGVLKTGTSIGIRQWVNQVIEDRIDDIESNGVPSKWPEARALILAGALTGEVSFDGTQDAILNATLVPNSVEVGSIAGLGALLAEIQQALTEKLDREGVAASAHRLAQPRTINLTGPVTTTFSFDGSGDVTTATSIGNDALSIPMVSGLNYALGQKMNHGAYGLGATALIIDNLNDTITNVDTMFMSVVLDNPNSPRTHKDLSGLQIRTPNDRHVQFLVSEDNRAYLRHYQRDNAGTEAWGEILHTGWFNPDSKMDASLINDLLLDRGELGAAIDLDTVLSDGIYYQSSADFAAGGNNYPAGEPGRLTVLRANNSVNSLIYQTYHEATLNRNFTRVRRPIQGWSIWREQGESTRVLSTDDIVSGIFSVQRGGTGRASLPKGQYLRGNGTDPVESVTIEQLREEVLGENLSQWFDQTPVDFATAAQGARADTALQPGDALTMLANDAGFIAAPDATQGDILQFIDGEWITTKKPKQLTLDGGNF